MNINPEYQYLDLLRDIRDNGSYKDDRTGTGTFSAFGRQIRFDLEKGFPLLTTKKVFLRGIIVELLWFLRGDGNLKYLLENDVHIWDEWPYRYYKEQIGRDLKKAKTSILNDLGGPSRQKRDGREPTGVKNVVSSEYQSIGTILSQKEFIEKIKSDAQFAKKWGNLGPVYGVQWRHWKTPGGDEIDQITTLINNIKKDQNSRRLIVSAWNVADIEEMAKAGLPPCHTMFQFYVVDGKLSCQLYQRSADLFLGVPFNIASYSLLTMMVAQVTGLKLGDFVHTFGDVHIYKNHLEQVKEQLSRTPRPFPSMKINPEVKDILKFKLGDFKLQNYDPHPPIKAQVAV